MCLVKFITWVVKTDFLCSRHNAKLLRLFYQSNLLLRLLVIKTNNAVHHKPSQRPSCVQDYNVTTV